MVNFFTDKDNFPTKLFVVTSILSLFFLGGIFIFAPLLVGKNNTGQSRQDSCSNKNCRSRSLDTSSGNPLITKVPQLKDRLKGPITDGGDPQVGADDAQVTIVEYADYQCQPCQEQEKILKRLRKEYGDKIRIIWKDYPVFKKNSRSFKAARAGRCAAQQEEFWPYHRSLYGLDGKLNKNNFVDIAKELDLNISSFESCLEDKRVDGLIMDNIKEAHALGISGIPFIYINDQQIMGKTTYEELKRLVELEMKD